MEKRNQIIMKGIKWIRETNETLLDLIFGSLIWSLLAWIVGLFIVSDRLSYTIGIALGTVVAVGMSVSMAKGLEKCLHMTRARGQWGMTVRSILRWLIMLAAVAAGLKFDRISFPGVILGIIGLKLAALLHVYTNTYITKRLKGEGR